MISNTHSLELIIYFKNNIKEDNDIIFSGIIIAIFQPKLTGYRLKKKILSYLRQEFLTLFQVHFTEPNFKSHLRFLLLLMLEELPSFQLFQG